MTGREIDTERVRVLRELLIEAESETSHTAEDAMSRRGVVSFLQSKLDDAGNLPEVRLECLDEASAAEVIKRASEVPAERRGMNHVRRDGSTVIIAYTNRMWPYGLADMASELGLAGDAEFAAVIACL